MNSETMKLLVEYIAEQNKKERERYAQYRSIQQANKTKQTKDKKWAGLNIDPLSIHQNQHRNRKTPFGHQKTNKYLHNKKGAKMNEIFKLIGDLGFPIAVALAGGYFVYLTIKLLLQGVLGSINGMKGIIIALDNRVKTMNHDVIRIDTIVSNALGLRPDAERIARADGKNDARRD